METNNPDKSNTPPLPDNCVHITFRYGDGCQDARARKNIFFHKHWCMDKQSGALYTCDDYDRVWEPPGKEMWIDMDTMFHCSESFFDPVEPSEVDGRERKKRLFIYDYCRDSFNLVTFNGGFCKHDHEDAQKAIASGKVLMAEIWRAASEC